MTVCYKCKSEDVKVVFVPVLGEFCYECQECGSVLPKRLSSDED